MEVFLLYLWTRLDILHDALTIALFASIAICLFATMDYNIQIGNNKYDSPEVIEQRRRHNAPLRKLRNQFFVGAIILTIVVVLIPTKKDAAIIAGGWLAKQLVMSEAAQEIGAKTYKLINGKLDEELATLKK